MKADLDTLKDSISITDLARDLGLQVRGKQARCFNTGQHKRGDKTPSLGLDTKTNRFKCFACGVQGSIIDLYKEVKRVSLSEAINELKKMAGLLPSTGRPAKRAENIYKQAGPSYTAKTPLKTPTKGIYEALGGYCKGLSKEAYNYLTGPQRGLTKETLRRFKLFSINDYQATNEFMKRSFTREQLNEAGLISDTGNLIFYQHKIIIPFIESGRIIFLQGRRTDNQHPKYMHLKRPVPLFNTDTLQNLTKGERVYICEGVFDAMMLEQNGFKAVAILGVNNFKPDMAELFSGLDVVLCLDNDEQGKQATQALARIFLSQGQSVKTKTLPEGIKDITEYYIK